MIVNLYFLNVMWKGPLFINIIIIIICVYLCGKRVAVQSD